MGKDTDRRPFPDGQSVYHQLRWDPRFDADACEIVLADRPAGTKVIAFRDYLPNGPIPWHRIIGFRYRGDVLWDRAERIDRRDEALQGTLGDRTVEVSIELLEEHETIVLRAHSPAAFTATPTVVTWNVLSDTWDAELLDHGARWARLLDQTLAAKPELVVFTESTDRFFAQLTAHSALREQFTIVSSEHSDVVLLSRATPTRTASLEFAPGREALVCWFDDLVFAGLHLPSDRDDSRRAERERDLSRLTATLMSSAPLIVAGDFNAQDDELNPLLARLHGLDVWPSVHRDAPGLTYDVEKNAIAGALTKRGRSSRLDRIVCFGERLEARTAELLGTGADHTSDHFGLRAELRQRTSERTSHRTAVVLLPPVELWGALQRLRARHDSRFERWPPHVSLLYGFVEPAELPLALPRLTEVAKASKPFTIRFDRVVTFEHEASTTVALAPSRPEDIAALQARLVAAFPFCTEQNRGEGGSFTPHLTIARLDSGDTKTLASLKHELRALHLEWPANAIVVLERPDEVFHAHAEIEFEHGTVRRDRKPAPALHEPEPEIRAALNETLEALQLEATIEPFGSRAWAPQLAGRDLDLLVTVDGSSSMLLDSLEARLSGARRVSRQVLRGDRFDVIAIERGAEDEESRRFALGVEDAKALRATLERHGRAEVFDALIPEVRAWSRKQGLEGNAFGYFGGIGWAVLLASPLLHDATLSTVNARGLPAWLQWLKSLDEDAVLGLHHAPRFESSGFTLLSPARPWRPITRAIIPSTKAALFEAFRGTPRAPNAWLTVRGPLEQRGAWLQRCLSIFTILDRDLGPVLRIRGEEPVLDAEQFTTRIGLVTKDTSKVQQAFVAQAKRLELTGVRAFVTPA